MRWLPLTLAASLALAPHLAAAQEKSFAESLQLHPKSVTFESPATLQRAPFVAQPGEPVLDLGIPREDERLRASRSSCDRPDNSLCYDPTSGRIVYKKTREYMPSIPGLRPEHISLKRDRITFAYSFE